MKMVIFTSINMRAGIQLVTETFYNEKDLLKQSDGSYKTITWWTLLNG
jgi:hypothetical protein